MADFFGMYAFGFGGAVLRFIAHGVDHDARHPGLFLLSPSPAVCLLQALNDFPFFFFGLTKRLFFTVEVLAKGFGFYLFLFLIEVIVTPIDLYSRLGQFINTIQKVEQLPVMTDK